MEKNNIVIDVNNLNAIYNVGTKDEIEVLLNVNYNFEKNKIYFIIGNSGSGKTVLISHLNGLLKSKTADIRVENYQISKKHKKIKKVNKLRRNITMVFQFPEYQLFNTTVKKDVMFGPINFGVKKSVAEKKSLEFLDLLGMGDPIFYNRSPFALSGGQKRRVAISGILAIDSEIIMFDEPTAGLDPAGERSILEIIKTLQAKGKTIIIVSSNMQLALEYADEIILLANKQIITSKPAFEFFSDTKMLNDFFIQIPYVMQVIESLIKTDSEKYKKLLELQPKNAVQLADALKEVYDGK
jgi:energy-coupling factor transport system ATP-binding protein